MLTSNIIIYLIDEKYMKTKGNNNNQNKIKLMTMIDNKYY
jgi:hypothetical protein